MLSRELQVVERARVHRRQNNNAPCPNGNGTTIGTVQEFTVLCNTNLNGDILNRLDASDFTACVDLCSSSHPKCEGASFDGSRCTLRANLRPDNTRFSRRSESAIGQFPGASSNCATLGGTQQALGTSFTTMCGFIIDGNDISQNFAPTFQDCLGQCATTSGCAAVSFDPSQDLGFKNCYLKTTVSSPRAVAADRRTDSAMLAAAAAPAAPSDDASSAAPPTADPAATSPPNPSPTGPGISTIALPSSVPANGGAVFFTPPGGIVSSAIVPSSPNASSTPVPTANPPAPVPAPTDLATVPSSSSLALGSIPPFVFPTPSILLPPAVSSTDAASADAAGQNAAGDGAPSMAWVAAPVVGGVAAVALIGVSFVLLRRRRRGAGGGGEKAGGSALLGWLAGWLPASWSSPPDEGSSPGGSRKTMTGMGNFSEVESGRRSVEARGSVRSSVVGFVTGRPMGMERLEDIEEGDGASGRSGSREGRGGQRRDSVSASNGRTTELRTSFNGLGQNKWSQ